MEELELVEDAILINTETQDVKALGLDIAHKGFDDFIFEEHDIHNLSYHEQIIKVNPKNRQNLFDVLKNHAQVESFNNVYKNKNGRHYYSTGEMILITTENFSISFIEETLTLKVLESYKNLYLIDCSHIENLTKKANTLREYDWILIAELNLSTFEPHFTTTPHLPEPIFGFHPILPEQENLNPINCKAHKHQGNRNINIAILDTGVQFEHEGLNKALVKDISFDFVEDKKATNPAHADAHGTLCAGLAAARPAQGRKGVIGVGMGCSVVSYRIGYYNYENRFLLNIYKLTKAFLYAVKDIHVISCSWSLGYTSKAIDYAIDYCLDHGRQGQGCAVVFAAGNENCTINFPAIKDNVLTVSACTFDLNPIVPNETHSWGSNHGPEVNISAPGENLLTTDLIGAPGLSNQYEENYNYTTAFSGTSAAAPQVAGCIGLMLSQNPNLSNSQIKQIIETTAQPFSTNPEPENFFGFGVLNVNKAIQQTINLLTNTKNMIDYSSNVQFKPEANNRFQAVYASQVYGTFFSIFAKFTVEPVLIVNENQETVVEEDSVQLTRVDLKLINYKGLFNIELIDEKLNIQKATETNTNTETLLLNLKVKAATEDNFNTTQEIILDSPITINHGTYFSIVRKLLPLSGSFSPERPYVNGVFDNEFYYRDGLAKPVRREVTDIDINTPSPDGKPGYDYEIEELGTLQWPGWRCPPSNSRITTK